MMKLTALATASALVLAGPALAQSRTGDAAASPAPLTQAVMSTAQGVCRPAADTQSSPAVYADAAGYRRLPSPPPNLPTGATGLSTWQAPSPEGRLYLVAGLLPQATTPATCLVALYDAKAPGLAEAIGRRLLGLNRGFAENPYYDLTTATMTVRRYDRRVGDTLRSVVIMDMADPKPDSPSQMVMTFTVDYGWLLHPGAR